VTGRPPLEKGPLAGITIEVDTQIEDFLKAHDWDVNTGMPSKDKLMELGLDDVAEDFYSKEVRS
jgi:aldehyde:ferredoxin oxidoreductase